jgi:galactokinase
VAGPGTGGSIRIDATLPAGSGLASSAALSVALAEVFGIEGPVEAVARLCQRAEQLSGVPVGAMDPLVCAGGRRGQALMIDFSTLGTRHVPIPEGAEVVVVDSGQRRTLRNSGYAARVAECQAAAALVGPLVLAPREDLAGLPDPLRQRARHVVSECERVRGCVAAFADGDLDAAGALMMASHQSLADDFAVSTPILDTLVDHLTAMPGVFGARMTGAGFGGCVVALSRPGAIDLDSLSAPAWRVVASDGTVAARG